eukprot:757190-Hanusia_phi.AAC.2
MLRLKATFAGDFLISVNKQDVQGKKVSTQCRGVWVVCDGVQTQVQEISHLIVGPQGSEVEIVVTKGSSPRPLQFCNEGCTARTGVRVPVKLLRGIVVSTGRIKRAERWLMLMTAGASRRRDQVATVKTLCLTCEGWTDLSYEVTRMGRSLSRICILRALRQRGG